MLNWGLGHASRSIPLIDRFIQQNHQVVICSDGIALDLLKQEYPDLVFEKLPSYNVHYKHESITTNIILALPNILSAIKQETKLTQELQVKYRAEMIISDNRYGCYSKNCPSYIMTHQLNLQAKIKWQGSFASSLLHRFLKRFDRVLIPDHEGNESIAGELINKPDVKNKTFLGPISRMKFQDSSLEYNLCIILSGPEPQRSVFEELLVQQLHTFEGRVVFIRGTLKKRPEYLKAVSFEVFDLLNSSEINNYLCSSKLILSRSGYSSLMDYYSTRSSAILIPTPGQTEQEYLAERMNAKGLFYSTSQKDLILSEAIEAAKDYTGFVDGIDNRLSELIAGL